MVRPLFQGQVQIQQFTTDSTKLGKSFFLKKPNQTRRCGFCSSLNFAAVGFVDSSSHPQTSAEDRKVCDVLQCSTNCVFCKRNRRLLLSLEEPQVWKLGVDEFEDTLASIDTYRLMSSENDDDGNPLAYLICLSVTVTTKMPDPFRGYCGPTAYFHKVGSILGSVSDFVGGDATVRDIEPCSGRLGPLRAEPGLNLPQATSRNL